MTDFILFKLNKYANYYICQYCENPLLFIEEKKYNEVNSEDNIIDNYKEPYFLTLSKLFNDILKLGIQNYKEESNLMSLK